MHRFMNEKMDSLLRHGQSFVQLLVLTEFEVHDEHFLAEMMT